MGRLYLFFGGAILTWVGYPLYRFFHDAYGSTLGLAVFYSGIVLLAIVSAPWRSGRGGTVTPRLRTCLTIVAAVTGATSLYTIWRLFQGTDGAEVMTLLYAAAMFFVAFHAVRFLILTDKYN